MSGADGGITDADRRKMGRWANDDRGPSEFECECGKTFDSKKGLGAHRGQWCEVSVDLDVERVAPETIGRFRTETGYTQAEIADAIGVSPGTVAHWERGANRTAPRNAVALRRLFDRCGFDPTGGRR